DLDQDVARADADSALPATCPEEQPGDDRNVVVPGDRLATAGAAASRRDDALPCGNARDDDVEEASDDRSENEYPERERDRHGARHALHLGGSCLAAGARHEQLLEGTPMRR